MANLANHDPNGIFSISDDEDDDLNHVPKRSVQSLASSLLKHNERVAVNNSKVAVVDFCGYCLQQYVDSLGADGAPVRRHLSLATNAEFDRKNIANTTKINLDYPFLGPILIDAFLYVHNSYLSPSQQEKLNPISNEIHSIYNSFTIRLIPKSINSELISLINRKSVQITKFPNTLHTHLTRLSSSPLHVIGDDYIPHPVVSTCYAYTLFNYCKLQNDTKNPCTLYHGCRDCGKQHTLANCGKIPKWMPKKLQILNYQSSRGNGRGGGRGNRNCPRRGRNNWNNNRNNNNWHNNWNNANNPNNNGNGGGGGNPTKNQ